MCSGLAMKRCKFCWKLKVYPLKDKFLPRDKHLVKVYRDFSLQRGAM
jgi:hypothetical protein